MCRTTTTDYHHHLRHLRRLKISAFYLRLSPSSPSTTNLFPDSVTLVLQPHPTAPLYINASKLPSDSSAFLSLHRILTPDSSSAVFATRDRLRASEGFSFEIHNAQYRLLKGVFRHDDDDEITAASWKMNVNYDDGVADINVVREAEVSVVLDDGATMSEKVIRPRRCRSRKFRVGLEDIPEERDEECAESEGACCCSCSDVTRSESDGEDEFDYCDDNQKDVDMEIELNEGVGWAVDVGIWVVCLGVGFLVSRASARRLRRTNFLR